MDEVTIDAVKNAAAKTFRIGEIWALPNYRSGTNWIAVVEEITDRQIIFKTLATGKIIRATHKQFSEYTKFAENNKKYIINYIFILNPEFLR